MWWPPKRSSRSPHRSSAACRSKREMLRPAALADVTVERDQERRAGRSAPPPARPRCRRRRDASPLRASTNAGVALRVGIALHLLDRLVEDALVERLPLDVEPLELARQPIGLALIVGEQEPKAVARVADPAGGVEPRPQDEAHLPGPDLPAFESAHPDQGPQPGPAAARRHEPESVPDQDAVLADQRHHVGDGGERDQVEQMVGKVGRKAERGHQRLHQLEGDAGAAELGEAGAVVRALRIDDRDGRGKLRTRQVVVGDDHSNPGCAGRVDRLDRGDAAVTGQDQAGAASRAAATPGGTEVVAVAQAVRQEGRHVGARRPQRPGEQRGGALAVHVVVAVDQDRVPERTASAIAATASAMPARLSGSARSSRAGRRNRWASLASLRPRCRSSAARGIGTPSVAANCCTATASAGSPTHPAKRRKRESLSHSSSA